MVGSHALQMSRHASSDKDEQQVPLASGKARKTSQIPLRQSLIEVANSWSRSTADNVSINAIAQLGEDRRRASISIRRHSLLPSDQEPPDPSVYYPGAQRGSIRAYRPSTATRRQTVDDRRQSLQQQPQADFDSRAAKRNQSILPDRRISVGERSSRRSTVADRRQSTVLIRTHRRSSMIEAVTQSTVHAVKRASLAM
jgi:hypothetical protein